MERIISAPRGKNKKARTRTESGTKKRRAGGVVLTRPYILRTEPTERSEYKPPSRWWIKSRRRIQANQSRFEEELESALSE
ncbi:MAG: hypothetical protein EOM51_11385 [Clostridia bacterium]|nr:hypothetical protein [Clostridia bacterium]